MSQRTIQSRDQRHVSSVTSVNQLVVPGDSCGLTVRRSGLPVAGWQTDVAAKCSSRFMREKRRLPPPPQNNLMFHESRYKTELCRQFEELGECEYGERCLFAHGMDELKNIPHRHPKFKTEKCSAYFENGFCSFGPRCSFIHEKPDAVQILLRLQEQVKHQVRPESVMDRLMHEAALLPAADSTRRLPVFTQIAP